MYAVIKTGGKQYKVAANDEITVEKIGKDVGAEHAFEDVLMIGDDGEVTVGAPRVEGAAVVGEVLDQKKGDKVITVKKRQRSTYRRKKGHRQLQTVIKITAILPEGVDVKKLKKADKTQKTVETVAIETEAPKKPKKAKKKDKVEEAPVAEAAVVETPEVIEEAPKPKKKAKKAEKPAEAAAPAETNEHGLLDAPVGEPDDLTKISGVGPVINKKLNALGVFHFWQIAAFTPEQVANVDEQLNFKGRIERDNWIEQAKAFADEA